jgi:hypothetical protein
MIVSSEFNKIINTEKSVAEVSCMTNENTSKFNLSGNSGQIGSVGDNNQVSFANNTPLRQFESIDLLTLANDLARLIEAMKKECKETEHYAAIAEVDKAQKAAKSKDVSKVKEYLKLSGKWALDIASKIGADIAVEALKRSVM